MAGRRLIQHKREALWFYRVVSRVYDRWVNPLFWTVAMRDLALTTARLDARDLTVVDVGAGTGFCTEAIVAAVDPGGVTMLDQSPDQLAQARKKPALEAVHKIQGDAEDLPFPTDGADRYVSTGSIEYWPDPQRAIAEAYRVIKPGGIAMVAGPLPPPNRVARAAADLWMLFPPEAEYRAWFEQAGFTEIEVVHVAPAWYRGVEPYALAIAGRDPTGPSPLALAAAPAERLGESSGPLAAARTAVRFAVGGVAGLFFVPVAAALTLAQGPLLTVWAPAARSAASATGAALVLWRFARPHTVVGTTLSVVALWLLALDRFDPASGSAALHLTLTLVAALGVNVAIVGINQVEDVEIDRVNKPDLPIAAGALTLRDARAIVVAAALVPLALALTQGVLETVAVASALAVGWAYSVPPLRLKRYPVLASVSISGVRGVVVNLGVWLHFAGAFGGGGEVSGPVWAVTAFVVPFSFAIAILKDVPDIAGDKRFGIGTFSVRFGPERVARLGVAVLTVAYTTMAIAGGALLDDVSVPVWVLGHVAALAALLRWRAGVDPRDGPAFTRFYMRVWALFFAEYALVATAALSG